MADPRRCPSCVHNPMGLSSRWTWIYRCRLFALLLLCGSLVSGCRTLSGLVASNERRVWMLVNQRDVFRCVDSASEGQPPKAACVPVPLLDDQQ